MRILIAGRTLESAKQIRDDLRLPDDVLLVSTYHRNAGRGLHGVNLLLVEVPLANEAVADLLPTTWSSAGIALYVERWAGRYIVKGIR